MLNRKSDFGPDIRYVSDWNKMILSSIDKTLLKNPSYTLKDEADIYMINQKKHKFELVGNGVVSLDKNNITIIGNINNEEKNITLRTISYPTLPCDMLARPIVK